MNTNYTVDDVVANWRILLGGLNEELEQQRRQGLDKNRGSLYHLPLSIFSENGQITPPYERG